MRVRVSNALVTCDHVELFNYDDTQVVALTLYGLSKCARLRARAIDTRKYTVSAKRRIAI